MFCLKCGEEIKPANKFCTKCGETTPEVSVQPQTAAPAVKTAPPVKSMSNILLRIVGAILILISVFIPFSSKGTASLWSVVTPFLSSIATVADMVPVSFVMTAVGFFLLLIGGFVSFFKRLIGGFLAIVGLIFLSATIHMTLGSFVWIGAMGLGYYLAWLGAFICLIAFLIERRIGRAKLRITR